MGNLTICNDCGKTIDRKYIAARLPGIGQICVTCLNRRMAAPPQPVQNKTISAAETVKRIHRPHGHSIRKFSQPIHPTGIQKLRKTSAAETF